MSEKVQVNGIFPHMSAFTSIVPAYSECGIGNLMPWGGKLWFTTYVADKGLNTGSALYSIDENMEITRYPDSISGTYFNRLILPSTKEISIGPYLIDKNGNVRIIHDVAHYRLAATMKHLTDPENKIYILSMEGPFFEVDLHTLKATMLYNLYEILSYGGKYDNQHDTVQSHIMSGVTAQDRVIIAGNTYTEKEFSGQRHAGRLAEFDGKNWSVVDTRSYNEVTARGNWGQVAFATGWDNASAIMNVRIDGKWNLYRLPKSSLNYEHHWAAESVRIREVETEGFLMDNFGIFYDLCPIAWDGKIFSVRPISSHLRKVPDFCSWRGMLVLSGDQVSPLGEMMPFSGDPQSNLWFGKTDDLWSFGKPTGWGGPWYHTDVLAGAPSDPYLMYGFDKKVLHLQHRAGKEIRVTVEIDPSGLQEWVKYDEIVIPKEGYSCHIFPDGFSAQWVRLTSDSAANLTANFIYS